MFLLLLTIFSVSLVCVIVQFGRIRFIGFPVTVVMYAAPINTDSITGGVSASEPGIELALVGG